MICYEGPHSLVGLPCNESWISKLNSQFIGLVVPNDAKPIAGVLVAATGHRCSANIWRYVKASNKRISVRTVFVIFLIKKILLWGRANGHKSSNSPNRTNTLQPKRSSIVHPLTEFPYWSRLCRWYILILHSEIYRIFFQSTYSCVKGTIYSFFIKNDHLNFIAYWVASNKFTREPFRYLE